MRTRLALALVVTIVAAACSSRTDETTSDTQPPFTAASTTSTTLPAATAAPTTTTTFGAPAGDVQAFTQGIGDPYYPALGNPGYDAAHYTLDLSFDPATSILAGTVTMTAAATDALDLFNLDFIGFDIESVLVDGNDAGWDRTSTELTIAPPVAIPAGEEFLVEVSYAGVPEGRFSQAIPLFIGWNTVGDQHYVVAEPDAARSWFPVNDHPLDKATYTFRITVPDGTTAAANGELTETLTDLGFVTWIWEMDEPMASYLATVVIGDFRVVPDDVSSTQSGIEIRNVLPPDWADAPQPALALQGEMIEFFASLFGPFPFDEYGIAVVDGFAAALENQTLSIFGRGFAESEAFEIVLVHELAHQWFGDAVSPATWADIWLNEGFASYAEWLWIEREFGPQALALGIEDERSQFATLGFPPPGEPPPNDLFNASVYRTGAMTLHALRLTVGDDAFFDILRTYYERFNGGTASTADFVAVAEEIAGEDLTALFDAWLYGTELPQFP